MAFVGPPGQFQYDLDGQPLSFVNSDDNKLFLIGQPVTIVRQDAGPSPAKDSLALSGQTPARATGLQLEGQPVTIDTPTPLAPAPGTGSIAIDESGPFIAGIRVPGTASLAITGSFPFALEPIATDALALASDAIEAPVTITALPDSAKTTEPSGGEVVDALAIFTSAPARMTGLKLESEAVTLQFGLAASPTTGSIATTGYQPDPFVTVSGSHTAVPPTVALDIGEQSAFASRSILVPVGAVAVSGKIPNTDPVAYPARRAMFASGQAIQVPERIGIPTIIIGGPYEEGTFILNFDATFDDARYEVCSRSGFKQKRGRVQPDAYDVEVRADSADKRHFADIPHRVRRELHRGSPRPEGGDTFIDPDNPVDSEDL